MTAADAIAIMEAAARLRFRVAIHPDGSMDMEPLDGPPPAPTRSTSAERTRRYRQRQAAIDLSAPSQSVTERHQASPPRHMPSQSVTTASQSVTERHIPETTPAPSPSLPTPLPSPPSPPQGKGVQVCAREPETDWLDSFDIPEPEAPAPQPAPEPKPSKPKHEAEPEAVAQKLPGNPSQELAAAWEEWQQYRQEKARAKLAKDRRPWTGQAARLSANQITEHAARLGERIVLDRITSAIAGNWQGLNLHDIATPKPYAPHSRNSPPNRNGTHEPLPQAAGLNRNRLPPKLPRP